VGLFDYFRRRRERESAVGSLEITAEPSARVERLSSAFDARPEEAADVDPADAVGLAELGQIGKLIASAAREGNIQVHVGEPQAIDMSGTDLSEEIRDFLSRHYGVEREGAGPEDVDAK